MSRPKGSKNKTTVEIEKLQQRIEQYEKQFNTYDEVLDAFVEGFVMDLYSSDVIKKVDNETLQKWFNNPDQYIQEINTLLTYYYIIDGNIFQLYDLLFTLPQLDYKITAIQKDENYVGDMIIIKRLLEKKINHKDLTRDLLSQLASKGTLLGTWLGSKLSPYFYTFDNLKYIYPYGRYKGIMTGVIDLEWLKELNKEERTLVYNNLSPLVTEHKYNKYLNNTDSEKAYDLRYIILPQDKSLVARLHTLNRNQRLGIPFGTQTLFDIQHKQKLKDLETAIANKIIRAIAILKFKGKDDNDVRVKKTDKTKVFQGVKKALEKNADGDNGITCVAIPDFAEFNFPEITNGDKVLSPDKYESINDDITTSTGISPVLTNGTKGNYASAKLNLDIIYRKIAILLEKIEEIYNQLFVIVLGERGENYIFEYNKETPIERAKKLASLEKLEAQGYAVKPVLDILGIDYEEYIKQSLYEIETLDLRNRIIPPLSTYTLTSRETTSTSIEPTNDSTAQSTEIDANNTPKANV